MVKRGRPNSKQSEHAIASKRAKDSLPPPRKKKACEKIHCPCKEPICFAQASERCTGNFWTSRWYHLSEDEHYCTECFEHFYKTNRPGYTVYNLWKDFWVRDFKGEAAIRLFMADQVLPFWVQCTLCEKWRLLPSDQELTPDLINDFTCDQIYASSGPPCDQPEAVEAQNAILPHWINTLSLAPMLKASPAFPLLTNYSPVALGMTASKLEYLSDNLTEKYLELEKQVEEARKTNEPFCPGFYDADDNQLDLIKQKLTHPFLDVGEEHIALAMRPDAMEEHEKLIFSEYSKEQAMYLCLRNVIYTLWMKDPTRWLTIQEVAKHLLCRGLSRIRCVYEAQRVLHHLTQRGIVNHGHLIPPPELPRLPPTRVIVVGGGVSGLAAGRHLSNLGMKITVLEACGRIGGRVQCVKNPDDGLTICSGADRVLGAINNPIASLAFQCGVNLQLQDESQMILQPGGTIVDPAADETVDDLFGSAINSIIEWRQNLEFHSVKQPQSKKSHASHAPPSPADRDDSLEAKLNEALKRLGAEKVLSREESQVLDSYKSLLEIGHGTSLSNVSAKMSVQNAFSSQFAGGSAMVPGGIGPLLEDLSSGLEVRLTCEVDSIKLVDSDECRARVTITAENGTKEDIDADYVVVAVPLHVLQKDKIKFQPKLPSAVVDFIGQLGCGVVEQIVAEFPHSFWRPSNEEHRCRLIMRTIDSQADDERGLFPFFVDVSAYDKEGVERFLLKSYVVGDTAKRLSSLSEAEVISEYIRVLRKYFGEIPEPLQNVVSSYASNDHIGMAYTYPKVGSNLDDIRTACDPVIDNTVFFAGEHFSQNFSRTLAGAYLSGLDAAARIVHRSLYGDDVPFIQSGI